MLVRVAIASPVTKLNLTHESTDWSRLLGCRTEELIPNCVRFLTEEIDNFIKFS